MRRSLSHAGFTLIELMVVIAVLAIQAGVAVPRFLDLTRSENEAAAQSLLVTLRSQETQYVYFTTPGLYATPRQMFDDGQIGDDDAASLGVATSVAAGADLDNPTGGRSRGYHFVLQVSDNRRHYRATAMPAAIHRSGSHVFSVEDEGPIMKSCPAGQSDNQQGECTPGDYSLGRPLISTISILDSKSGGLAIPMAINMLETSDVQKRALTAMDANTDGQLTLKEVVNADIEAIARRIAIGPDRGGKPMVADALVRNLLRAGERTMRQDAALGIAGEELPGMPLDGVKGDAAVLLNAMFK
jgi:prepilin-type N-terminal cleavage/methylation domain-containing protein